MKKLLLTSYFIFFDYYSRLDKKHDSDQKHVWRSATIVLSLPFSIMGIVIMVCFEDLFHISMPPFLGVIVVCFTVYYLVTILLFKIYKIDKYKNDVQQRAVLYRKCAIAYPIFMYIFIICLFLVVSYLRNGYLIKS